MEHKHMSVTSICYRKLTLDQIEWHVFPPNNLNLALPSFIESVRKVLGGESRMGPRRTKSEPMYSHSISSIEEFEQAEEKENFWDSKFGENNEVAWFKFQQAFLNEFELKIATLFDESQIPWLLDTLKNEVFEATSTDVVAKTKYLEVLEEWSVSSKGEFWTVISEIATEKYNIKEVFNIGSSVRLTAVRNLGKEIIIFNVHMFVYH